jgi:hypothetical protein
MAERLGSRCFWPGMDYRRPAITALSDDEQPNERRNAIMTKETKEDKKFSTVPLKNRQ